MADTKPSNPKDAAATTRLDLSLFPASARAYGALAMTEGDLKYGGYNYREAGVLSSIYYAACGRHLDKWFNGEDFDPNTQVHHLANALACIAVLIDSIEQGNLNDDRPPQQTNDLYERMEKSVADLQGLFPRRVVRFRQPKPKNDLFLDGGEWRRTDGKPVPKMPDLVLKQDRGVCIICGEPRPCSGR